MKASLEFLSAKLSERSLKKGSHRDRKVRKGKAGDSVRRHFFGEGKRVSAAFNSVVSSCPLVVKPLMRNRSFFIERYVS